MPKLIIFDWDDTLVLGSTPAYMKCYHETITELGVLLSPEEETKRIREHWAKHPRSILCSLLQEQPSLLEKACHLYEKKLLSSFPGNLSVIPGTQQMLERLTKYHTLCIATGINPTLWEIVMDKFHFPRVFSQMISAYQIPADKQKPDPYMIHQILAMQNASPSHTIMVGDSKNDVLMAYAAGVVPVVVLTGHLTKEEAEKLSVKDIISDSTKLETILDY